MLQLTVRGPRSWSKETGLGLILDASDRFWTECICFLLSITVQILEEVASWPRDRFGTLISTLGFIHWIEHIVDMTLATSSTEQYWTGS